MRKTPIALKPPCMSIADEISLFQAINKPAGITSARFIEEVQRHLTRSQLFAPWLAREAEKRSHENPFQKRRRRVTKRMSQVKIGHGGTLDPMATGVLILGLGRGTKSLPTFLGCTKSYETVLLFGSATDTYDTSGKVLKSKDTAHLTPELVREKLQAFRGTILQTPPLYSALHMDGKRLYEYAREGKPLPREIQRREVSVAALEMTEWLPAGEHAYRFGERASSEERELAGGVEALLQGREEGEGAGGAEGREAGGVGKGLKRKAEDGPPEERQPEAKQAKVEDEAKEESTEEPTGDAGQTPGAPTTTGPSDPKPNEQPSPPTTALRSRAQPSTSSLPGPAAAPPTSSLPAAKLTMTVTSGFYVRSLCQDLALAAGTLGAMAALVRTRQAHFTLGENVLEMAELEAGEEKWGPRVRGMLEEWERREAEGTQEDEKG